MAGKKHVVKCRYCQNYFDAGAEPFVMPSKGWYYHEKCYQDFKGDLIDDEKWKERIYDFISHDLKKTYDYYLCEAQRKKLLIAGRTNKGIYFALRYFYEIKHGDLARSHNSIGIVEYIYDEACDYWCAQELNHRGVVQAIEKQIEQQEQQSKRFVKRKKNREKNDFEEL